MKSLQAKLAIALITIMLIAIITPVCNVYAVNDGLQLIQTTEGNTVVYVEGLENEAFDYALSSKAEATEMELNYANSVQDDEGNQVALITPDSLAEYLHIRKEDGTKTVIQLNVENIYTQEKMNEVENTTKRIKTEAVENLKTREETREDIIYTYSVGGLKITDDQTATYSYVMVKLPDGNGYSNLQSLADELSSEYEGKTMYSKIEFANKFSEQYHTLIEEANLGNNWQEVADMQILQNEDYENEEKYVILLKKVATDGEITYDAKFMTTYFEQKETVIPASTQNVETQETSKLPITGDSIILFILLAVLVVTAVLVFIKMKKSNQKAEK